MLLRESYFLYALRDDDQAFGRENVAKEVYDYYMAAWDDEHRIDLPKLPLLRYMALQDFLSDQQFPPSLRRSLLGRIKIERPNLFKELTQQEEKLREQLELSP